MGTATSIRVQKHRDVLRQAGLRPVQLWVPDTRRPDFAQECRRQSSLVAQADSGDGAFEAMLAAALDDIEGWNG